LGLIAPERTIATKAGPEPPIADTRTAIMGSVMENKRGKTKNTHVTTKVSVK